MFNFLKPKTDKPKKDKDLRGFFDLKRYDQLVNDMTYAKDDLLMKTDGLKVYGRVCQECLYLIYFVDDFDLFLNTDASIKALKMSVLDSDMKFGFDPKSLDSNKVVKIVIIKEKSPRTIDYAKKHCGLKDNKLVHVFVYNKEEVRIEYYRYLPDFSNMMGDFNNLLFFDLACHDTEVE